MRKLSEIYLRISPGKFHFLKFILEGYDNLAILSSFQGADGIVVIRYPNEMAEDLFNLLGCLAFYLSKSNKVLPLN
jgi:arginine repressor